MLDSLLNSLSNLSNSTNASVYLKLISSSSASALFPLFIDAKYFSFLDVLF